MKALLAVLLFAVAASAISDAELYQSFVDWTVEHNKVYDTALEHAKRFENFKANVALVRHLNRQNRGRFALNKFADLSQEEFEQIYLHPIRAPAIRTHEVFTAPAGRNDFPTTLDWRDKGAVNAIKDQKSCGSCWAFSVVANIEGVYFVSKGKLPNLSEQQLVDCEKYCMIYPGTTEEVCDDGCDGGLMPNAEKYAGEKGMMTQADYPYKGYEQTCAYNAAKAEKYSYDWTWVDKNEDAMVAALNTYGPLSIGVCASSWSYYSGGIFNSTCSSLNHGVALVGYGVENGKEFWIIRNSWGTSWGERGYIRLARGYNRCLVNTFVSTVKPL